jgi:glycosyltransferase involved in cell wall biosynthesis
MSISVVILTFNEEANLPACLAAVGWSDDIVVVDSFSQDRTVDIARRQGARVYERVFDDFATQRNFALNTVSFRHDWILHIDADEIVTPALRDEILRAIQSDRFDAYRVPSKMIFRGRWLRYSGLYPSYQVRLGHRDRLRFKQVGHGQREDLPADRVGTLLEPYLHDCFSKGLTDWVGKHNRYSSDEALATLRSRQVSRWCDWRGLLAREPTRRRRALKDLAGRLPLRPSLRFLYMYVLRRGFLDGSAGLTYCKLLAMYEYLIVLKTRELMDVERTASRACGEPLTTLQTEPDSRDPG